MFGDNLWCVKINGRVFKGDLSKREAEAMAERYQRGLCKHKDFRDHVEICRDKEIIKEADEIWKTAKRGEMQKYQLSQWIDD